MKVSFLIFKYAFRYTKVLAFIYMLLKSLLLQLGSTVACKLEFVNILKTGTKAYSL